MPILNITQSTTIANQFEVADNPLTRMKGLIGRSQINQDEAMIITGCNSIHMMFMAFAIDVIFLDGKNVVVGLVHEIKPFQFSPVFWKSACAIELPPGTIDITRTQIRDQISVIQTPLPSR